jgi:hypothetical protein
VQLANTVKMVHDEYAITSIFLLKNQLALEDEARTWAGFKTEFENIDRVKAYGIVWEVRRIRGCSTGFCSNDLKGRCCKSNAKMAMELLSHR